MTPFLVFLAWAIAGPLLAETPFVSVTPERVFRVGEFMLDTRVDFLVGAKFDPTNAKTFLSLTSDGALKQWNLDEEKPVWAAQLPVEGGYAGAFDVSQDGETVVVAGTDGKVWFVEAKSGALREVTFAAPSGDVLPIAPSFHAARFSEDGRWVAAGTANGRVFLWPVSGGEPRAILGQIGRPVQFLDFAGEGAFLISSDRHQVSIWDMGSLELVTSLQEGETDYAWIEHFNRPTYGRWLFMTTYRDTILYDVTQQKVARRFPQTPTLRRGDEDAWLKYGPLTSVVDRDLSQVFRFYKEPYVERIDVETSEVVTTYHDPKAKSWMGMSNSLTMVEPLPGEASKFLVGMHAFGVSFLRASITSKLELRVYELPAP